jgi:long-chain fatty acid transport protein
MRQSLKALLLIAVLLIPGTVLGSGYAVWEMGTRSSALGGTMTAHPVDASAIFYNPAGLTSYAGNQLVFNVTGIKPYTEFAGTYPYGKSERLADALFILPQMYYSHRVSKSLALGVGFYTPYGLAVEWENPETFSGRDIATFTDLKTYFLTPTLSWKPSCMFSVGAGLNVVKGEVHLEQAIVEKLPNPIDFGTAVITGSSDWSYGFNLGLLVKPHEKITLGLNYKSKIDLTFNGDADFTPFTGYEAVLPVDGPAATALPLPALYSVGLSANLTEKLRAEFNYNFVYWSEFEELELIFYPDTPVEFSSIIPENYEDSKQLRLGLEYTHCDKTQLRAGWVRDTSPQPSATTGPVLPDSDRTGYSFGSGHKIKDNIHLDTYMLLLFLDDREIRDNHDDFNGDYHSFTFLFGLGLTYNF